MSFARSNSVPLVLHLASLFFEFFLFALDRGRAVDSSHNRCRSKGGQEARLSAAGRAKIAAAARKRWAKVRKQAKKALAALITQQQRVC